MIKPINKEQLPICLEIMKRSYEKTAVEFGMTEYNCPYRGRTCLPFEVFEKEFDDGHLMYGYICNNEIVGFLSLLKKENEMYIQDIAILSEYQNKGIGSELMDFAKEKAKELNCDKISLGIVYENMSLRNWYERKGFQTVGLKKFEKVTYTVGTMELKNCYFSRSI